MEMDTDYNPIEPLPAYNKQPIEKYFKAEPNYIAVVNRSLWDRVDRVILHRKALHFVYKHSRADPSDAFIPYLAINYFDRFIASNQLPGVEDSLEEDVKLLAICCLTLAWKMRSKTFIYQAFLARSMTRTKIDPRYILRMELRILNGLSWRMRSVAAVCFVQYFFSRIPRQNLKHRTINEIIVQSEEDFRCTEYKPSIIAASAVTVAYSYLYHEHHAIIEIILSGGGVQLDLGVLNRCVMEVSTMCMKKGITIERPHLDEEASDEILEIPEQELQMNFKLKWITDEDKFRKVVSAPPSQIDAPAAATVGKRGCKLM